MDKTNQAQANGRNTHNGMSSLVFRFRRSSEPSTPKNPGFVPPFTELPEELQDLKAPIILKARRFLNALLLLVLALALLALIAAFAYQLIYHPQILAEFGLGLVKAVEGFFQRLIGGR
jgi:hypothetical protein